MLPAACKRARKIASARRARPLQGAALPDLPVSTPWSFVVAAELLAISIGLAAGVLPARRAARLDPVEALRAE